MTKHKNVALDELRILAALMVLGVHTGQKVGLGDAAAVGAQGVQLFFVLSGYLAAASLSRYPCLLYTSPSRRDRQKSRMPSSA